MLSSSSHTSLDQSPKFGLRKNGLQLKINTTNAEAVLSTNTGSEKKSGGLGLRSESQYDNIASSAYSPRIMAFKMEAIDANSLSPKKGIDSEKAFDSSPDSVAMDTSAESPNESQFKYEVREEEYNQRKCGVEMSQPNGEQNRNFVESPVPGLKLGKTQGSGDTASNLEDSTDQDPKMVYSKLKVYNYDSKPKMDIPTSRMRYCQYQQEARRIRDAKPVEEVKKDVRIADKDYGITDGVIKVSILLLMTPINSDARFGLSIYIFHGIM